jgi:hypothetical protein
VLLGIATGIAAAIGVANTVELLKGYKVLIIVFAIFDIIGTTPYLYIFHQKKRPGQQVPPGTPFYLVGIKSVSIFANNPWHPRLMSFR